MLLFVSDKDREGLSLIINKVAAKLSSDRGEERGECHNIMLKIVLSVSLINDSVACMHRWLDRATMLKSFHFHTLQMMCIIHWNCFPFQFMVYTVLTGAYVYAYRKELLYNFIK